MGNSLKKWRDGEQALDVERRLMNEALARLGQAQATPIATRAPGRLLFGLDLTGSRQPSLNAARIATAAMFATIRKIGRVAVRLVYYRGTNECQGSPWVDDPDILCRSMLGLTTEIGETQIARLLRFALDQNETLSGVVFIGDHCEDNRAELWDLARLLGNRSIPLFVFHECADHDERSLKAKPIFKRMAEESGGAYVEFRPDSGAVLRELLQTVGAFSAAGAEGVRQTELPRTPQARQLRGHLLLGTGSETKRLK